MLQRTNPSLLNTTSPTTSTSSQPIPFNPQFHDPIPSSNSSTTTTTTNPDDFLDHMLSSIPPCTWSDLSQPPPSLQDNTNNPNDDLNNTNNVFDESAILASKLMLQQHLLMASRACGVPQNESLLDGSPFNSPSQGGEGLYNGFGGGSLAPTHSHQQFHPPQAQNFGGLGSAAVQAQASGSAGGGGGAGANQQQPKQRVRARRGQATDPHSIAERLRRERIAERMKSLQELVPNANKTDKASMLDEIIDYVKFLQLQVKVLSMSRLGGAAAVAPLVADMSSEGGSGVECVQGGANGARNGNQTGENIRVTEQQVAKLMEEDMGSAMQYLQGKGLCLMPISLANAISTATSHGRTPVIPNINGNGHLPPQSNGEGPSSPNFSTLTVQSANVGNVVSDGSVKDAASVCNP